MGKRRARNKEALAEETSQVDFDDIEDREQVPIQMSVTSDSQAERIVVPVVTRRLEEAIYDDSFEAVPERFIADDEQERVEGRVVNHL